MDRQTALAMVDAISRGEMTADEAPAELWMWLSQHVSFEYVDRDFRAVITD